MNTEIAKEFHEIMQSLTVESQAQMLAYAQLAKTAETSAKKQITEQHTQQHTQQKGA